MKRIVAGALAIFFMAGAAAAQQQGGPGGGPGPVPDPWTVNGSNISYSAGTVVIGTPTGAAITSPGNVNISGGYYVNGVPVTTAACATLNCAFTNVANTFTASPQTVQGATTTSPGWYAQITGDTFARVRVGLNSTDVASVAFGPGNAARDTFIERVGAGSLRFGAPDAAAPVAQTSSVQNVVAGTSNTAGANRIIAGSQGTGTGIGGSIIFQVAPAGSSGSAQNALTNGLVIFGDGGLTLGNPSGGDEGSGTVNIGAPASIYNNGTAPTGTGAYVRAASPSLVTPILGVAAGTSLALGGATIGGNALAVTGTVLFNTALSGRQRRQRAVHLHGSLRARRERHGRVSAA